MRTNVLIDDTLINDAKRLCGFKTKKETIEVGLETAD